MLRIVTGPFHPHLEQALVGEVQQLRAADPLAPLAIVVPSGPLGRRLKWLLCIEHRLALLNVHVLTFHQLAVRLLEEAGIGAPQRVRPEFFFKELIHLLLRRLAADFPAWSGLIEMPGAWAALWTTLRDLKDAKVEADRVLDALSQSDLVDAVSRHGPISQAALRSLLNFYDAFLAQKKSMEAFDQDDLASWAEVCVPTSDFLRRQRRVLYYGFYDLTQVQLDFFQAVARASPATLFFPLVRDHPSFLFAQRFFERYIHGLVSKEGDRLDLSSDSRRPDRSEARLCHVVNVSGREDEVAVVAKDILRLVEEQGYAFQDIGVVARTFSGYETVLPRVFEQHGVPFVSTMGRALAEFPFIKAAMQLLQLQVSGYRRDHMMDLLCSPFIRLSCIHQEVSAPRPDLWDLASRRLGIAKGIEEWRRLTAFVGEGLPLRDDEEGEGTGPRIPAEQVRAAWNVVTILTQAVGALPEQSSWSDYVARAQALFDRFLDPPSHDATPAVSDQPDQLYETFRDSLEELKELTGMGSEVSLPDFVAAFRRLMEETVVPIGPSEAPHGAGVQVLDAMAARGISFRALYILGLNEKVFPRHIREDAFLRDGPRRFLEADLGFKIQEKLAGYDEEKLLFRLLCNAARHHLMLLYQRTDDAGRMLVPSSYLGEIRSQAGSCAELTVPRRLTRKFEEGIHYRIDRLTPVEAGIKFLLDRTVPHRLLNAMHPAGRLVLRGLQVLRAQERGESRLGAYDGITGPLEPFWAGLKGRGVSPTALQDYATCPFRYFAKQALRLNPLVIPDIEEQIGPIELGVLAHGILRLCLQRLREQGYFAQPSRSTVEPSVVLEEAARQVFDRFAGAHPVGFPLVWELQRENLVGFLRDVLRDDLAELSAAGWEPVLFEESMSGTVEVAWAAGEGGSESFPVAGRLDRVDWSASRNVYRIIDYKFKVSREPETLDKNLVLGAVRGLRFQPPLYLAISRAGVPARLEQEGAGAASTCAEVWFYYLASKWEHRDDQPLTRVSFPGDAWSSDLRVPLGRVVSHVLGGIKSGRFFIYPDGYCDRCEYRLICRKTHQPTLWRIRSDHALVKPHREMRRARLPDSRAESKADASAGQPKDSGSREAEVPATARKRRRRRPSGAAGEKG